MTELEKLYKNTIEISKNISLLVAKASEDNKEELADLNVSQLEKGISGDGDKMNPNYSPNYAKFKGFRVPDLKVSGDYHSSISVKRVKDKTMYYSKDDSSDKVKFLESYYRNIQYGIAPQNEQKAVDEIESDLAKRFNKVLKNGVL
jgi:hypothetical protein